MSLLRPFAEARAVLGVSADADAAAVKRAYRKLVLAHPPDTDPEGFRRVRDAFELITTPGERVREMLLREVPAIDPPPVPPPQEDPVAPLALVLLRLVAAQIDAELLLAPTASPARTPKETRPE